MYAGRAGGRPTTPSVAHHQPPPYDDAWNAERRDEAPMQRAYRNFAELLQELRVAQTSVQVLFGFILWLSFTDRFIDLDRRR